MDWDRERRKDDRFALLILAIAVLLIAAVIVFQPVAYPLIAARLRRHPRTGRGFCCLALGYITACQLLDHMIHHASSRNAHG
jgi:hypothetical protein